MIVTLSRSIRTPLAALGAGASAFYLLFIARSAFAAGDRVGFTLFDDAMISMRYARNLAEGSGLVWNPGERVEGMTNPLWTLWMAGVHAAGASDEHASLVVMLSGAALLVATAFVAARVAHRLTQSPAVAIAAFALVSFNYALSFWTLRGMEVGLLALLAAVALEQTLAVEADDASPAWLCASLALANLTRRDAAVIHIAVFAYLAWTLSGRRRLTVLTWLAATLGVSLGVQIAFSTWYYGDSWPNTYYLKLGGVTVEDRLRRGIPALAVVTVRNLLPLMIAASLLLRRDARLRVGRPAVLLVGAVAMQAAYSAYVGGDAWEYMGYTNRYLTIAVPALCVLAAAGLAGLSSAGRAAEARFVSLLLGTIAARIVLEAVLRLANRGVARGEVWFQEHRMVWVAGAAVVAGVLLIAAIALEWRGKRAGPAMGSFLQPAHRCAIAVFAAWVVSNGPAFAEWLAVNASSLSNDVRGAQTGLAVRRLTSPDTVIAVTSAGNVPYFSRRRAIDILGKSDRVIARMAPVNVFVPGHNKWNLDHSIRDGSPDLVWGLPRLPGETTYLRGLGYQSYPGMCFARRDSTRVDHERLWRELAMLYPDAPPLPDSNDAARIQ